MNTIKLGEKEFPTLLAITTDEQEKGLMHCKSPPPSMSFVYKKQIFAAFWMQNVSFPLDIVFCCDNKIISIRKGIPNSTAIISSGAPSDLVIELPADTCKQNGIKVGDHVSLNFDQRSLMKKLLH